METRQRKLTLLSTFLRINAAKFVFIVAMWKRLLWWPSAS